VSRSCRKWPLAQFKKDNEESLKALQLIDVELYIDDKNYSEIVSFLNERRNKTRFHRILIHILQNQYNDELYRKEVTSEKTKNITAMKFKGGRNPRIYCQEYFPGVTGGGKKIVMIHFLANKDFQRNNKKIIPKLESIASYEYTFK
jgi:hypothetical protein